MWNADDKAEESREFDMEAICGAIRAVAGEQGPLECASLGACSTYQMGLLLKRIRLRGTPRFVCIYVNADFHV